MRKNCVPPLLLFLIFATAIAQGEKYPLEGLTLSGTKLSEPVVMEIAGLRLGAPIDKADIDQASTRLGQSGLFESVSYQFKPGPKRGYLVSFSLPDQSRFLPATIDLPGVEDAEVWKWMMTRFPDFNRRVPNSGAAQEFLAHEIERHTAPELHNHHVISQMETTIGPGGGSSMSFHLDVMPRIAELRFTGQQEVPELELRTLMAKVTTDGYMERQFRNMVELNLRGLYEQHGMYRVKFPGVQMERTGDDAVVVTTRIEEGLRYTLGAVQFSGEGVSSKELVTAGKFRTGSVANWREIELNLRNSERVFTSAGYLDASAVPARAFDDERKVLALNVPVNRGPLYHLGQVRFRV